MVLTIYHWVRRQVIGRLPWGTTFVFYRLVRRFPRVYFMLRAVLMSEMVGRSK